MRGHVVRHCQRSRRHRVLVRGRRPGRPAPLRGLRIQLFRDLHSALDGTWQVCIIRVERDSRRGAAEFIPPAEAAGWSITRIDAPGRRTPPPSAVSLRLIPDIRSACLEHGEACAD